LSDCFSTRRFKHGPPARTTAELVRGHRPDCRLYARDHVIHLYAVQHIPAERIRASFSGRDLARDSTDLLLRARPAPVTHRDLTAQTARWLRLIRTLAEAIAGLDSLSSARAEHPGGERDEGRVERSVGLDAPTGHDAIRHDWLARGDNSG
jgi:hypothetical protein